MSEIFNKDVSVLGGLTLNPSNGAGDIVTIDGAGVIKFRTPSQIAGDGADATYIHNQAAPLAVWTVTHSLNKKPSVLVVDTADTVVVGQIEYINNNNVTLTFNGSFSGYAYFN
jgi:hypothetical protein